MAEAADNIVQGMFDATGWQSMLAKSERGKPIDCWQNVSLLLQNLPEWKDVLGFDAFTQVPMILKEPPIGGPPREWSSDDEMKLGLWFQQKHQFTVKSLQVLNTGMLACAKKKQFHPVVDWLKPLEWDQRPRLEFWLTDCLGVTPTPYSALVGKFFIMNMVRRVMDPGCIMRYVPVLEGIQNRNKSNALKTLAGQWYSDAHLDLSNKDAFELIQGTWLHEIAEMGSFNRAEANRVKHFISSTEDFWVPKWIRGRIRVRRQVCFAGTTNERQYLKDWTGNTRMLPMRCMEEGEIDIDKIAAWREQLFAEAIVLVKRGERAYATPQQEKELFIPQQDERLIEHPWRQPVMDYLEFPRAEGRVNKVNTQELLVKALHVDISKMTLMMQQDVGRIMDAIGWVRRREPSGARGWYYHRPEAVGEPVAKPQQDDKDIPI